ncbi:WD40/YVTN/BNR-like repeat-containing protein [Flavitalea flava]
MPLKFPLLLFLASFLIITGEPATAQKIEILTSGRNSPGIQDSASNRGTKASFRGLSVVSDKVVWVSGSQGTIGKSLDGGKTWQWIIVPGYEKRDFRDIEAFDEHTAIIMAIAEPANILKTTDGGKTWVTVYENKAAGMFLDAMEFWNKDSGIVLGDPVNGKFFIARSFDGGNTWHEIPTRELPEADSGEACFASSGTNVRSLGRSEACFVSGGLRSRLFIRDSRIDLPLLQGKETTGANSVAVKDNRKLKAGQQLIVVGGDFSHDTSREKNCTLTFDGGKTWISPQTAPHGYRSCVEYTNKDQVLSCGTSGVDISADNGLNWQLISGEGFYVCRKAKKGKAVFLAGGNGRIAKLVL